MAKRGADRQMTKDEYEASESREDDEPSSTPGKWTEASEETLAKRQFATVKRKDASDNQQSAFPTFNLTNPEASLTSNAFAKFAAAPGEWECSTCEVRNKKEANKCKACESPNPNPEAVSTETAAPVAAPIFTFGAPASATEPSESASLFTASFSPSPFTNLAFGSGFGSPSAGLTFGSVSAEQGASSSSGLTAGTFTFEPSTSMGGTTSDAAAASEFKDRKAEPTGEEGETTLLKMHAKCYTLQEVLEKTETAEVKEPSTATSEAKKKYQESGEGDLHINISSSSSSGSTSTADSHPKARLVMRADRTQRLVLNCALFKAIKVDLQGDKYLRFGALGEGGKVDMHLLKFKSKQETTEVLEAVNKAIAALN